MLDSIITESVAFLREKDQNDISKEERKAAVQKILVKKVSNSS